ncbi:hypothetical protein LCGC14_2132940, partial [marine sediment metagenome]
EQLLVNEVAYADFESRESRNYFLKLQEPGLYRLETHGRLAMSLKVVSGMEEAMDHIDTYGSAHTESIITRDHARAMRFIREVDSSSVMVNASTRFADGFQYGLGAEIGIATDKLHARGPMGLVELTCQKFIVLGNGQTRT